MENCRVWQAAVSALVVLALIPVVAAIGGNPGDQKQPDRALDPPPEWAYVVDRPAAASRAATAAAEEALKRVSGSKQAFAPARLGDLFSVPDWFPEKHPLLPEIVASGRKPDVFACGFCHLPNGQGRPENSSLAGLPVEYIIQQMADFKSGLRKSSEPQDMPVAMMAGRETKASEEEIVLAAKYFSGIKLKPWIRVVETATVPKTHASGWMLVADEPVVLEPIGDRIIETPEDLEQEELRNDESGFIAYAPLGSVKKGRALVNTGGAGKTVPCATCHGPDLRGFRNVPSIAGRSPSYVVRQLFDIRSGSRHGVAAQGMKATVENLDIEDMAAIAAYLATLQP